MIRTGEKIIGTVGLTLFSQAAGPQMQVKPQPSDTVDCFAIAGISLTAKICYDSGDDVLIGKAAQLLAKDIKKITDRMPELVAGNVLSPSMIIIGTLGKNSLINQLAAAGKIQTKSIRGQWERFSIETVDNPFPGVTSALIIAGSDRRGTAYGVFSLSEAMGVSPWHWWADVPVNKYVNLYITKGRHISKPPSVKYRGIFINDEDWGFHPWSGKTFDPELGDIGPKAYEKVYQLLLRLKGNMLAPAMHSCTRAFYTVPGNMEMADDYGIIITTSHCEPLLYNNASEWDKEKQGEWNYLNNKEEINRVLRKRVKQAAGKENIYTIALRGIHDEAIPGVREDQMREVLEAAIRDQRIILSECIDKPIEDIPLIFVPYKEVLKVYEQGIDLPGDITIVWPDDNYGYMKRLSSTNERDRSGGAGVYYHISYLGWPNDYLWLNTTSPALMYAELHKAFTLGAQQYWLLNAGDIKPGELGIQLFLDMAWDLDKFSFSNIHQYQAKLLAGIFDPQYEDNLNFILERYYYHAFTRKPEYMTWDFQWNSHFRPNNIKDTDYSFIHYNEAENRLHDYKTIAGKAGAIMEALPPDSQAAFFQMVYYPVKAASLYNHELLIAQQNRWYATQKRSQTNALAVEARRYHDELEELTNEYNNILDGKWKNMMPAPGFIPEKQYPPVQQIDLPPGAELGLYVEGTENGETGEQMLPRFNRYFKLAHFIEVYNKGSQPLKWQAKASEKWIHLDTDAGKTKTQQRIHVSIDWENVPAGEIVSGEIEVTGSGSVRQVKVVVFNPPEPSPAELKHFFVENNGVVCIPPADFRRKTELGGIRFEVIEQLGYSKAALQLGHASLDSGQGSHVEYDFYTFTTGEARVYVYALPLFAKEKTLGTRYSIQIDDGTRITFNNDVAEYSMDWANNVIRNSAINSSGTVISKPGRHTLKLLVEDPGMIIQKIIIDLGGLKKSYTGPAQ